MLFLLLTRVVAINGREKSNMFSIVPIRTFAFGYNVYGYIKGHINVNNKNTLVKPLADIRVFGQCAYNPVLDKTSGKLSDRKNVCTVRDLKCPLGMI